LDKSKRSRSTEPQSHQAGADRLRRPLRLSVDGVIAMRKALENVVRLYAPAQVTWIQALLERTKRMPGATRLLSRMASAPDKEQTDDYIAEAVYALVFAGLGFTVTVEPLGREGPDLEVSRDGRRAVVEITRFRKVYPGPPIFEHSDDSEGAELSQYGDPTRDIAKAFEKLRSKLSQVRDQSAIIAVWNDDGDLVEWEVRAAVALLCRSAEQRLLTLPDRLLFVLYGSQWVRAGDHRRQLYCFPVSSPMEPYYTLWQQELGDSTVQSLVACALAQERLA